MYISLEPKCTVFICHKFKGDFLRNDFYSCKNALLRRLRCLERLRFRWVCADVWAEGIFGWKRLLCPEASLFIHVSLILELKLKMLKGKRSGPRELSLKQPNAEFYSQTLKRLSRNTLTVNTSPKSATPTLSYFTHIFQLHKQNSRIN